MVNPIQSSAHWGSTPHRVVLESEWDGQKRRAVLYVPKTVEEKPPMLVFFHGGLGTGNKRMHKLGLDAEAEKRGVVVLAPNS